MSRNRRNLVLPGVLAALLTGVGLLVILFISASPSERPTSWIASVPSPQSDAPIRDELPSSPTATPFDDVLAQVTVDAGLHGRISDEDDIPIAHARVTLVLVSAVAEAVSQRSQPQLSRTVGAEPSEWEQPSIVAARSGLDGMYSTDEILSGLYYISVSADGRIPARRTLWIHGVRREDFILSNGCHVAGRVVDNELKPVQGALVHVAPSWLGENGGSSRTEVERHTFESGEWTEVPVAETDSDGLFSVHGLTCVSHRLDISKPDYIPRVLHDIDVTALELEIRLERGATVVGKLSLPDGVAQATVHVVDASDLDGTKSALLQILDHVRGSSAPSPLSRSLRAGEFEIAGVPAGTIVVVGAGDGLRTELTASHSVRADETIDVGELRMQPDATILGTVVDHFSRAVTDARVRVVPRGQGAIRWGIPLDVIDSPCLAEDTTLADGSFEVHGLPDGAYDLQVWSFDHAPAVVDGVRPGATRLVIQLRHGVEVKGRVVDLHSRLPIEGAVITADPSLNARSDISGTFTLSGLTGLTSSYETEVEPESFVATVTLRHSRYRTQVRRFSVLTREAPELVEFALEPRSSVVGIVVDAADNPVAGAAVSVTVPGLPPRVALPFQEPILSITGTDGHFELLVESINDRGAKGEPQVVVRHPLYGESSGGDIELLLNNPIPITIVLTEGCSLRGRVTDESGNSVADAELLLRIAPPLNGRSIAAEALGVVDTYLTCRSDFAGEFEFPAVKPGELLLTAKRSGFALFEQDLSFTSCTELQPPISVRLSSGWTVIGEIRKSDGSPLSGAEIVAIRLDSIALLQPLVLQRVLNDAAGLRRATTDAHGQYTLTQLPLTPIVIAARARGFITAFATLTRPTDQPVDLTLEEPTRIVGAVVDAALGQPITRFMVTVSMEANGLAGPQALQEVRLWNISPRRSWTVWDDSGVFVVEGIPTGQATVSVRADGSLSAEQRLQILSGLHCEVRFTLNSGWIVSGRVVESETSTPVSAATVSVRLVEPEAGIVQTTVRTRTRDDGTFSVGGVALGRNLLTVHDPGFVRHDGEIVLNGDADVGFLRIQRAASLVIRLFDLPPRPTAVSLFRIDEAGRRHEHTAVRQLDPARFEAYSLKAGEYTVHVRAAGYTEDRVGVVSVESGQRHETTFPFRGEKESSSQ